MAELKHVDPPSVTLHKIGYRKGSGGTVTQAASKSTAVQLDKLSGEITLHNAALAADAIVSFTLNNERINGTDLILVSHHSGGTLGAYVVNGRATGAGTAQITVANRSAGSLGEAIVLKFAVFRTASE